MKVLTCTCPSRGQGSEAITALKLGTTGAAHADRVQHLSCPPPAQVPNFEVSAPRLYSAYRFLFPPQCSKCSKGSISVTILPLLALKLCGLSFTTALAACGSFQSAATGHPEHAEGRIVIAAILNHLKMPRQALLLRAVQAILAFAPRQAIRQTARWSVCREAVSMPQHQLCARCCTALG
eukprot:6959975-Prymnesium_polylepis.1